MINPGKIVRILKNGLLEKYRLPSLKRMVVGGTGMKLELQETLMKALPHTEILRIYGKYENLKEEYNCLKRAKIKQYKNIY